MKTVFLIDRKLPLGLIANTAAALGLSLGSKVEGLVGPDIFDKDERIHIGITKVNLPILGTSQEEIKAIREKVYEEEFRDILVIDFCSVAQKSKRYEDYTELLSETKVDNIKYLGICLYGSSQKINKLTGGFSLL
ncbi:MAG: hypothetical protein H6Q73_1710 [Firmicutes bacterium]|nr:hypothetical protein [Bacillota bacterium]